MESEDVIRRLQEFRERIRSDVAPAYVNRGASFGRERFQAWKRQFTKFLDEQLPAMTGRFLAKLHKVVFTRGYGETDISVFMREDGEPSLAFIDSLILDIQNNEIDLDLPPPSEPLIETQVNVKPENTRVFIVHGHDELTKTQVARFVEKLGFEAVILHEQPNQGMTVIEKIEMHTNVGFAIVIYSEDDKGNTKELSDAGQLNHRARQNVVFEHGYLIAKLGRPCVVPLVKGMVELPSDISGMVYVDDSSWPIDIAKEMRTAGYKVDFNLIA